MWPLSPFVHSRINASLLLFLQTVKRGDILLLCEFFKRSVAKKIFSFPKLQMESEETWQPWPWMGRWSTLLTQAIVSLCLDGWRSTQVKRRRHGREGTQTGCSRQLQVAFLCPDGLSDFWLVTSVSQSHHLFDTLVIVFSCLFILMVHLRHTEFKWWAWRPFQPVLDIEFVYQYQLLPEVIMNDACNNKIVNNFSEDTVELHFLFFVVRRYNAKFNYS